MPTVFGSPRRAKLPSRGRACHPETKGVRVLGAVRFDDVAALALSVADNDGPRQRARYSFGESRSTSGYSGRRLGVAGEAHHDSTGPGSYSRQRAPRRRFTSAPRSLGSRSFPASPSASLRDPVHRGLGPVASRVRADIGRGGAGCVRGRALAHRYLRSISGASSIGPESQGFESLRDTRVMSQDIEDTCLTTLWTGVRAPK